MRAERFRLRFRHYRDSFAKRWARIRQHILQPAPLSGVWWLTLAVLWAEMWGIGESYETLHELLKRSTRPLTPHERAVAVSVFGESLQYDRILIDEAARIGCRKGGFAYVSFYLVNTWGRMTDSHLLHELMHVWQYERVGASYMVRAVQAQHSPQGYNYGGITALREQQIAGFGAFNFEQQADIVCDYYRLRTGQRPQWGDATAADLPVYAAYMATLRLSFGTKTAAV